MSKTRLVDFASESMICALSLLVIELAQGIVLNMEYG